MGEYRTKATSREVWAVIHASHPELKVFGSYSAPDGDDFGDPAKGIMVTSYGFDYADCPIIEAITVWDVDRENPHNHLNKHTEYWLCFPQKDDD